MWHHHGAATSERQHSGDEQGRQMAGATRSHRSGGAHRLLADMRWYLRHGWYCLLLFMHDDPKAFLRPASLPAADGSDHAGAPDACPCRESPKQGGQTVLMILPARHKITMVGRAAPKAVRIDRCVLACPQTSPACPAPSSAACKPPLPPQPARAARSARPAHAAQATKRSMQPVRPVRPSPRPSANHSGWV